LYIKGNTISLLNFTKDYKIDKPVIPLRAHFLSAIILYSFLETKSIDFPLYLWSSAITRKVFFHFLKHVCFRNFNLIGQSYLGFLPNWLSRIPSLQEIERSYRREWWESMEIDISRSYIFPRSYRMFTPMNTGNLWFNPKPIKQEPF